MSIIDGQGYRLNIGIVLRSNKHGQLLLARRDNQHMWQFPQGGLQPAESVEDAMFRELKEELGLYPSQITIVAKSNHWYSYRLPKQYIRKDSYPICIGQKQKWFLLNFHGEDDNIQLDTEPSPEFVEWRWFNPLDPLNMVIFFKKNVYQSVLSEFMPFTLPTHIHQAS